MTGEGRKLPGAVATLATAGGSGGSRGGGEMAVLDGGGQMVVLAVDGDAIRRFCPFSALCFLCFFSFPFLSPAPLSLLPLFFSLKMAQGGAAAGAMERNRNGGVAAQCLCQPVLLFSFFFTVLQQGEEDG